MLQALTPRVCWNTSSGSPLHVSDVHSKQLRAEASVLVGCGVVWRALARCARLMPVSLQTPPSLSPPQRQAFAVEAATSVHQTAFLETH